VSADTTAFHCKGAFYSSLAVAANAALIRVHAACAQTQVFKRDRSQRAACKFARGHKRIKLTLGWLGGNFLGKFN